MRYSPRSSVAAIAGFSLLGCAPLLAQQPVAGEPPPNNTAAPRSSAPVSAETVRQSGEQIDKKLKELAHEMAEYQRKVGDRNTSLAKWAGTAELHQQFAQSVNDSAAACELVAERYARAKDRDLTDEVLGDLKKRKVSCEAEIARQQHVRWQFKLKLDELTVVVKRVERDIQELGRLSDDAAKARKAAELERQVADKVDQANSVLKRYDTKK